MDKFKIGDRIRLVKDRDNAKAGMVGTIVSDVECGDWGVKFDNKFYGGHGLNGECGSGYGQRIAPQGMELFEGKSKAKFYVGQRVRVRPWEDMKAEFGTTGCGLKTSTDVAFNSSMREFCGRIATIAELGDNKRVTFKKDFDGCWTFTTDMLEPADKFEVGQIYRMDSSPSKGTIARVKSISESTAHVKVIRGDKHLCGFDQNEKVTLLTGPEISEAIRKYDAEHSETGVREVKRHAKVGDTIKIINRDRLPSQYKVGKTYKVTEAETRSTLNPDGGVCVNKDFLVIGHQSYVVVSSGKHSYTAEQIAEAKRIVLDALKDLYQNCKGSIVFGTAETNSNIIRAYFFFRDKTLMRSEKGKRVSLEAHNVGYASAKCSSNDEPNEWIGKCVALCKALHKPIPAFITGD